MTYEQEQQLLALVRADSFYQQLLRECIALEPQYQTIKATLPENQQEILDQYISLCEELEYRRTTLAFLSKNG